MTKKSYSEEYHWGSQYCKVELGGLHACVSED